MSSTIHLGFEVGTGRAIAIPVAHIAITGQTQLSGKTTTLEALIHRSGLKAVAFITKRGEESFREKTVIPPYFRERTDWEFVVSLLEASMQERLKFQRSWIMKLCAAGHLKKEQWTAPLTLSDVRDNCEIALGAATGLNESVYTELKNYLEKVLPQLEKLPYVTKLELGPGLNVMDLGGYDEAVQSLVVAAVIDWVHQHGKRIVVVIPEAWKFIPEGRNTPVTRAAERLMREGAVLKNFVWLDSQDLAGVKKTLLRSVAVWVLGVQRQTNEIKRTLDEIHTNGPKPLPRDIAMLGKGQFYVCHGSEMARVYVQPAWLGEAHARAIATGEEPVSSAAKILRTIDEEEQDQRDAEIMKKDAAGCPDKRGDPARASENQSDGETSEDAALAGSSFQMPPTEGTWDYSELFPPGSASVPAGESAGRESGVPGSKNGDPVRRTHVPRAASFVEERVKGRRMEDQELENSYEALYVWLRERVRRDPGTLLLINQQPVMVVKVERPTITADGATLRGRLARMIHGGFFNEPRNGNSAFNELKRLGASVAKPNVYRECDKLAEMGFLTKEGSGYQRVAGMKIEVKET